MWAILQRLPMQTSQKEGAQINLIAPHLPYVVCLKRSV